MIFSMFGIGAPQAQNIDARIDAELQNITSLLRPGCVGYATFWNRNSYVQRRRISSREFHCEAAGTTMQPSLKSILTPERLARLDARSELRRLRQDLRR